jgi:hypothetical protein
MSHMTLTIENLIADFYARNEHDVGLCISVKNGFLYAVGGHRANPSFHAYEHFNNHVSSDFLSSFLWLFIDKDPDAKTKGALGLCWETWLKTNPCSSITGVFGIPFKDKNVRIYYCACPIDDVGQIGITIRFTMYDKDSLNIIS